MGTITGPLSARTRVFTMDSRIGRAVSRRRVFGYRTGRS